MTCSMLLVNVKVGKWVKVLGFKGGIGLEHKLRQLGMLPGDCARVIRHAPFGGPMLIEIEGRSIALGKGIATKILVEDSTPPCV